jgi:hypothetical protein
MNAVRYNGVWYKILAKAYEPERQTHEVAWMQIREPLITPERAYIDYFARERRRAKVLYPSFRKEDAV